MPGPNILGRPSPLTGWTSSTLAPKAATTPAPRLTGKEGMKQLNEAALARQGAIAPDAEGQLLLQEMAAAGAAAGGPSKPKEYHDALYEFIQRNPKVLQSMFNRDIELFARPREGSLARVAEDAKEKTRERQEKAFEKQEAKRAKLAEKVLKGGDGSVAGAPIVSRIDPNAVGSVAGAPIVSRVDPNAKIDSPADAELARRTAALKPAKDAEDARVAALTPEQRAAERKATFDARIIPRYGPGGLTGGFRDLESGGGGGGGGGSSGGGGALGPNPRIATANSTPLEQLLSQMFPDLVGTTQDRSGGPLGPDLRGMGAPEGPFNNIIANLGLGGGTAAPTGGGWVPGPAGGGADIAGSIPGAPAWLGNQINNLPGGGSGGFFAPPAPAPRLDLAGLAALSGEQERQRAAMLKAQADASAAWQAQLLADQQRQQQQDQLNRLRLGGSAPAPSGWQSPTFKPSAWTPTLPAY